MTDWDERYVMFADHIVGVMPNEVLIAEVSALPPGRALDVGCGVGADAVWLAQQGWTVTALDVSRVALEHAAQRASAAAVEVTWLTGRVEDVGTAPEGYDLVTALYPALPAGPGAARALASKVGPGGMLIVVHHANIDVELARSHGFDPADYLSHEQVVALLDDAHWDVRVHRSALRERPVGPGGAHTHDDVVVARRHHALR